MFRSEFADAIRQGLLAGATAADILFPSILNSAYDSDLNRQSFRVIDNFSEPKSLPRYADFRSCLPSSDVFYVVNWIVDVADNADSDSIVIDKKAPAFLYSIHALDCKLKAQFCWEVLWVTRAYLTLVAVH